MPEFNAPKRKKQPQRASAPLPEEEKKAPIKAEKPVKIKKKKQKKTVPPKRKKHSRRNYVIYYVAIFLVAVTALSLLSVTVLFNVNSITVEGTSRYTTEEIVAASNVVTGVNLIRLDGEAAEKSVLEKLIYLDEVKAVKEFPETLKLVVTEAIPIVTLAYDGDFYVISAKGRILEESNTAKTKLVVSGYEPLSTIPGSYLSAEDQEKTNLLFDITDKIAEVGFDAVTEIDISDRLSIVLRCGKNVELRLGSVSELEEKLTVGKVILADKIGANEKVTILLDDPTRIVVRPADSVTAVTTPAVTTASEPVPSS